MPIIIKPQPRQEEFMKSPADVCVYGGSAGGGKTWSLLVEALRGINNPGYRCVIFRRTMPQIMNSGGLFDASLQIYSLIPGAVSRKNPRPHWIFPSGAIIYFGHLQYENTVLDWQGTEITLIEFDEATHFEESQFWYMLSRNRSTCGIRPYFRMSTNPEPDSFVRKLMAWWIDDETGYAIPERSGIIRYMARVDGEVKWGGTKEEVAAQGADIHDVKSFTFVMSSVYDNQELIKRNPDYIGNLKALPIVEQERLLYGNWNIRPAAGLIFPRGKVNLVEQVPNDVVRWVRAWDFAATAESKDGSDNADYTAGVLLGKRKNGRYIVADVINRRLNAADVRQLVLNTAKLDKAAHKHVKIRLSQDAGQAGKAQAEDLLKLLSGFGVSILRETGDKVTRANPFSAQWTGIAAEDQGNVDVLLADWTETYLLQMDGFPTGRHDDMVDASANAFHELTSGKAGIPITKGTGINVRPSGWVL